MLLSDQWKSVVGLDEPAALPRKDAVEALAERKLRQSSYPEVRRVACHFHEGVLTLRGRVPSYYLKQVAQSLVHKLAGVEQVDNRLHVPRR